MKRIVAISAFLLFFGFITSPVFAEETETTEILEEPVSETVVEEQPDTKTVAEEQPVQETTEMEEPEDTPPVIPESYQEYYGVKNECQYIINTKEGTLTIKPSEDPNVNMPEGKPWEAYNKDGVTWDVFKSMITHIIIEEGITSVDGKVFQNNDFITSVMLPSTVKTLPNSVFYQCTALKSVVLPSSLQSTGYGVFDGCSKLETIVLPDTLTSIANSMFNNCSSLTTTNIPNSVTSIGTMAFSNCVSLSSIEIPNSVTSIGFRAFTSCFRLTELTIPDSIKTIEFRAFYDCHALNTVTIPNSVTKVEEEAFHLCNKLRKAVYTGTLDQWNAITIEDGNEPLEQYVYFPVKGIELTDSVFEMYKGYKKTLTVVFTPEYATNKTIKWTSSDAKIASVNEKGEVTGIAQGNAIITATSEDGSYVATCTFMVQGDFPFKDVKETAWYRNTVEDAYKAGIMKGLNETTFGPNENMTRAQVAVVLHRLAGSPNVTFVKYYTDVADGKYYSKAVTWAKEANVIAGYSNGKFGYNDPITREQLAIILNRYVKSLGLPYTADYDLTQYSDASDMWSYSKGPIQWTAANGIMGGSNGKIRAKAFATRAECSKMFLKTMAFIQANRTQPDETGDVTYLNTYTHVNNITSSKMKLVNQTYKALLINEKKSASWLTSVLHM